MLLINEKVTATISHGPVGVSGPTKLSRLDMHSEPRIPLHEWPACFCARLIGAIDRDENLDVLVRLCPQRLQQHRQRVLPAIDWDSDSNKRPGHSAPRTRSAQTCAKYGAI